MQSVSATFNNIISGDYYVETKLVIDGVGTFDETKLFELTTTHQMFGNTPTVGLAVAGEIDVKMLFPVDNQGEPITIPTMACLRPMVRVRNATQTSEWIPQGVFFIDTRERTVDDTGISYLTLHGFDAMLKAEVMFNSEQITSTTSDVTMVKHIAKKMGLWTSNWQDGVDARTFDIMNKNYSIPLPVGYTFRQVLGFIAGLYGGSFIMSDEGKLRLVAMYELPKPTHYLITTAGANIVIGNNRILV